MFDKLPSLLDNIDLSKHYHAEPYPHLVIENLIDKEQIEFIRGQVKNLRIWKNNFGKQSGYGTYRTDYHIPEPGNFRSMFSKLCEVFGFHEFKELPLNYGKEPSTKDGVCVNSVVCVYDQKQIGGEGKISKFMELGPHRDREQKILTCLLYLGQEGDNLGGDLMLYKAPYSQKKSRVGDKTIELVKTVPYAPGTLVIFQNSGTAVHSVGERKDGPFERAMVCISFETYNPAWASRITELTKSPEFRGRL